MKRKMTSRNPDVRRLIETLRASGAKVEVLPREWFEYSIPDRGVIKWNISKARQIIAERYAAILAIPLETMQEIRDRNEVREADVAVADPNEPGIAAPIIWEGAISYIVIDGLHRNARALQLGQSFKVKALTDEDSRACIMEAPEGVIP